MKVSDLPLNEFNNVSCYDKDKNSSKIIIPEGFVKTRLTVTQLKILKIETVKGHVGFDHVRMGGRHSYRVPMPVLVNLIAIEDEPKANDYITKLEIKKKYRLSTESLDWLFK